jgi:hypothetical protein
MRDIRAALRQADQRLPALPYLRGKGVIGRGQHDGVAPSVSGPPGPQTLRPHVSLAHHIIIVSLRPHRHLWHWILHLYVPGNVETL